MSKDRKEEILGKVRKLLAKAAGTNFEGEAQVFQAKADELMTAYAIETWELGKTDGSIERVKPEKRNMDISWWWQMREGNLNEALWSLFWACARHTRCVIIHDYASGDNCPVVGLPMDLDYMDLLFTDLMIQMIGEINPKPDPTRDYYDNLKMLREAGVSWPEVAERMVAAGFSPVPNGTMKNQEHRMTRDYRAWCKRTGTEQNYNHWRTYRRNFADAFVSTISLRMSAMRETTQGEAEPTGSMALALRDIRQVVNDAVNEFFPDRKLARGRAVADNRKIDWGARVAGKGAGERARITSSGAGGLKGKKKELG